MKEKKIIHIRSKCFNLEFNYNGHVLSSMLFLLTIFVILSIFVKDVLVLKMIWVFFGIIILISLVLLLNGFHYETREGSLANEVKDEKPVDNTPPSNTGEHTKKKSENVTSNRVINNKVPVPNPTQTHDQSSGKGNNDLAASKPSATKLSPSKGIPMEALKDTDWDGIFNSNSEEL